MIDLGIIFINAIIYFIFGMFLGILPIFFFNYLILLAFSNIDDMKKKYIFILFQLLVFGIVVSLVQFFSRSMVLSYTDMLNIVVFILLLISGITLLLLIIKIFSQGTSINVSAPKGFGKGAIPTIIFFVIFFGAIVFIFLDFITVIVIGLVCIVLVILALFVLFKIVMELFSPNTTIKFSSAFNNVKAGLSLLLILIILFSSCGYLVFYQANFVAPIEQAQYFNGLLTISKADLFKNEIADNQVRLIDQDLATSIIQKHASEFGSNVVPISIHITTRNGRLVWVGAMGPDNYFNQKILGLLVLDANNPDYIPEVVNLTSASVSEGLFYDAQTSMTAWNSDPMQTYGRAYITWVPNDYSDLKLTPGELVQVQTYYTPVPFGYQTRFGGVKILDLKGAILETFSNRLTIPSWVSQSIDQTWLESNIANWGNLKSGPGFDIFAGGFLGITQPSQDRLEISQTTRYIISPDTNETVAVTPVHPSSNHLTNAGVFLSTANSITYYDYHDRSYISTDAVEQLVESNEPQVAQGEYYATLPMLYPIIIGNSSRLVWYVPVYHRTTTVDSNGDTVVTNVQFRGLYIYDSVLSNIFGRAYLSDFPNSVDMVKQAKENYRAAFLGTTPTNTTQQIYQNATVTQKSSYVQDGTTYIVFKTNNTNYDYLYASPKILSTKDWITALMDIDVGSNIQFQAYKSNNIWYLSAINKV